MPSCGPPMHKVLLCTRFSLFQLKWMIKIFFFFSFFNLIDNVQNAMKSMLHAIDAGDTPSLATHLY